MKLILGSSSPFRKKVLEGAGISFDVVTPDIDEKAIRAADNHYTPFLLSFAKAQAVAAKITEPAIIIACDQVIICNGQILEKAESPDDVRRWYKMYSEHDVEYVNGVTALNTATGACITTLDVSVVDFAPIPDGFTEAQIVKGEIFKCCGALGDETERTYGTIRTGTQDSVIGLPLTVALDLIKRVS